MKTLLRIRPLVTELSRFSALALHFVSGMPLVSAAAYFFSSSAVRPSSTELIASSAKNAQRLTDWLACRCNLSCFCVPIEGSTVH